MQSRKENIMWRFRVAMIGVLALSGCQNISARPAAPMTVEEAIHEINGGLARIPNLNDSDILSDERGPRYEASRKFIHDRQCSSGTANPLLLTSLPMKLHLKGGLDEDGSLKVAGLGGEVDDPAKSGSGETFEIPLRISALSDFPHEYLKERVALLESGSLPGEVAEKLKREVPETYEKLVARIGKLVNAFDPATCPKPARFKKAPVRFGSIIFVPPTF